MNLTSPSQNLHSPINAFLIVPPQEDIRLSIAVKRFTGYRAPVVAIQHDQKKIAKSLFVQYSFNKQIRNGRCALHCSYGGSYNAEDTTINFIFEHPLRLGVLHGRHHFWES